MTDWQLEAFLDGYITCAFWADADNDDGGVGRATLSDDGRARMEADCRAFVEKYRDLMQQVIDEFEPVYTWSGHGHDFWLSRNGHGAGFWDRGYGELGDRLTAAAKTFPSCSLYVGDDGKAYVE